jgi:hypothetical protein
MLAIESPIARAIWTALAASKRRVIELSSIASHHNRLNAMDGGNADAFICPLKLLSMQKNPHTQSSTGTSFIMPSASCKVVMCSHPWRGFSDYFWPQPRHDRHECRECRECRSINLPLVSRSSLTKRCFFSLGQLFFTLLRVARMLRDADHALLRCTHRA